MSYLNYIKKHRIPDLSTIYHDVFDKKDPHEFKATGSQIYHGRQRQGKTLGMVYGFHKLKRRYPRLLIVSNIHINYLIVPSQERNKRWAKKPLIEVFVKTEEDLKRITDSKAFQDGSWQRDHYIYYQGYETLLILLKKARNGKWGTCFMIDEIHQYFHSHDSKAMPVWVAQIFSQQMKQYILVLGTVQKWENVIKALREQIQHLILANRIGWYIRQLVVDPEEFTTEYGETSAPVKKVGGFFMTKIVRESYDTLALIESGREIFGGGESPSIVVNTAEKERPKFYAKKRAALK